MNPALLYLSYRSLRGQIVGWLRLMRQPKYLLGLLVGLAYFWFFALRFFLRTDNRTRWMDATLEGVADFLPAVHLSVALFIAVAVSLWWLFPFGKSSLDLKEAELHVLLPAPIPRRHILQYAVLKNQRGILIGCLIISLFSVSGSLTDFSWRFLTVWMLLSLWDLHARGRGLWIAKLGELSAQTAWRRRLALVFGIGLFWLAVAPGVARLASELLNTPLDAMADQLPAILAADTIRADAKLLSIGLSPFVWLTEPLFAGLDPDGGPTGRLASLLPLLFPVLLLILHNEWVVRSQVGFEEASLARSRREAAKKDAASRFWKTSRARRRETPFRLVPRGRPETAIVWKNLMLAHRTPLARLVLYGFVAVGVLSTLLATTWVPDGVRSVIAGMLIIAGVMTLVFMPLMAGHQWHNDLRSDLLRVELIRTWPLASWRLFAAEVVAPTIVATLYSAGGAGLILAVAIGRTLAGPGAPGAESSGVLVPAELAASLGVPDLLLIPMALLGALPLLTAIACLSATLQNLLTLLFPSWVQLGPRKTGPAAHMGQGILTMLFLVVAIAIGLLPGSLLVAAALWIQIRFVGIPLTAWEFPVIGLIAALPLLVIVAALVILGGAFWDRLDPSEEILGGTR